MVAPNSCGRIQKCGPNRTEFCYNKSDIFGVLLDFTFLCQSSDFFLSPSCKTSYNFCVLISNWRINVSIYISSHNDIFSLFLSNCLSYTYIKGEKVSIIYRLADCTCLSFAIQNYLFTRADANQNSKLYGTELNWSVAVALWIFLDCSFCLVKQKLLLQHMDW